MKSTATAFCDSPEYHVLGIYQSSRRLSIEKVTKDGDMHYVTAELTQLDDDDASNIVFHVNGSREAVINAMMNVGKPFEHGESIQEWRDQVQACFDVAILL